MSVLMAIQRVRASTEYTPLEVEESADSKIKINLNKWTRFNDKFNNPIMG